MKDLDKLTMDELHGIPTAYELRIKKDKPSNKEATFKSSNKTKKRKHESSDSFNCELDAEEAFF